MEGGGNKLGNRVALFPLPFVGHINPMLELGNILHAKGFSISIIHTRFNSPDPTKHSNFTYHPIDDGLTEEDTVPGQNAVAFMTKLNANCVEPLRECLSGLMSSDDDNSYPVACLIADTMLYSSQFVADSLKIPRIVLRTGNLATYATYVAYPMLTEKGYFSIRDTQPDKLVPGLPPLRVRDLLTIKADPEQVFQLISNVVRQARTSRGIIFNTFVELEDHMMTVVGEDLPSKPVFPIGPFHKYVAPSSPSRSSTENSSVITWLNSQSPNSVIYVSFGTMAAIDQAQFSELAWGLADSNQPFLWVVRSDLVQGMNGGSSSSALPNGFLEKVAGRACIIDWAPQKEVLAHPAVGGFWTHGGWNSTLESICEGVPMICLPFFGDQMMNARFVTDVWKIGLRIESTELNRGKVQNVVRRLVVEKEGDQMRKRAQSLKDAASAAIESGGSSYTTLENLIHMILSF